MERFRELTIQCDDEYAAIKMLEIIKQTCNKPPFVNYEEYEALCNYKQNPSASREIQENHIVNQKQDNTVARIVSTYQNTTKAKLILRANGSVVEVVNIIPYESKPGGISVMEYNIILEAFKRLVVDEIDCGNKVDFPSPEFSLETQIPLSYHHFLEWVKSIGDNNAPFENKDNLKLWYGFVTSLVTNNEFDKLSSSDLELWLKEQRWEGLQVEKTISHYENDLQLLDYQINKLQSDKQIQPLTKPVESSKKEEVPIGVVKKEGTVSENNPIGKYREVDKYIKDLIERMQSETTRIPSVADPNTITIFEQLMNNELINKVFSSFDFHRVYYIASIKSLVDLIGPEQILNKSFLNTIALLKKTFDNPILIFNLFNYKSNSPMESYKKLYTYGKKEKRLYGKRTKYLSKTGSKGQVIFLPSPVSPEVGEDSTFTFEGEGDTINK